MLSIVLYAAFTGLSAVAQSYWMLLAFRFLTGLGCGGEFALGTTLGAELWTAVRRGRAAGALTSAFGVGCPLGSYGYSGAQSEIRPDSHSKRAGMTASGRGTPHAASFRN
jgi:MFS family permease